MGSRRRRVERVGKEGVEKKRMKEIGRKEGGNVT